MIRIVLGVLLFVIGMGKLFYSGWGILSYNAQGAAPEWQLAESIDSCETFVGGGTAECTKLMETWFDSIVDFIFLQWISWGIGFLLGILILTVFVKLLRDNLDIRANLKTAIWWQIVQSLFAAAYIFLVQSTLTAEMLKHDPAWGDFLFVFNMAEISQIVFLLLLPLVFVLMRFLSGKIFPREARPTPIVAKE